MFKGWTAPEVAWIALKFTGSPDILAAMDLLWTPWRYNYVTSAEKAIRPGVPKRLDGWTGDLGCVFCNLLASVDHAIANGMPVDEAEMAGGLVLRGKECFICLNAFPYTSGHVMVIPHKHEASLAALPESTAHELMDLAQKTERALLSALFPARHQFWVKSGAGGGGWSCGPPASAWAAAVDWRYQFHDYDRRDAGDAGGSGYYVEAAAGRVWRITNIKSFPLKIAPGRLQHDVLPVT